MTREFTVRNWGVGHQRVLHRISVAAVDLNARSSSAFVSVREWSRAADAGFIGAARMFVCNVVVGPTYVDVWIQIDWDHDLEYELTLLVVNF